ncbi:glutathione S-transferase family protein [Rhodophyticola sp. CCM32]|uniref:glutathione S-transferase family protein n=1 Tax=Rhodophyticola sp. CCM32 TaxID=2916397 RepID=UPI00107F0EEA|nr:glutathione S-transferase family protein [Rhodophyticola sp. CCM32]QBY01783.1 glutathione S-transferase family protein [Rhodophyticola sp. CCM32]
MAKITLYASKASRSLAGYWVLEELGIPYTVVDVDLRARKHLEPEFLKINPSGRVPVVSVDGMIVSERPAICALLADRFGYGSLAPKIDCQDRGPYLKWLVYATTVVDPAIAVRASDLDAPLQHTTWDTAQGAVEILEHALDGQTWLLGDWFTAADVAIGSIIAMARFNNLLPESQILNDYVERLKERPAFQRSEKLTWPPEVFSS